MKAEAKMLAFLNRCVLGKGMRNGWALGQSTIHTVVKFKRLLFVMICGVITYVIIRVKW